MYLVSIYFDEKTDNQMRKLIKQVAEKTGNVFMTENQVPPHITIAALETRNEQALLEKIEKCLLEKQVKQGEVRFVSAGVFLPSILYIQPVLNGYLHGMSVVLNDAIREIPDAKVSNCYQPFSWLPHMTIGKQLTNEQMTAAFEVIQKQFVPITGQVTKIGIAKPNPHRDLKIWQLMDCKDDRFVL